jgi:hypothetical protein
MTDSDKLFVIALRGDAVRPRTARRRRGFSSLPGSFTSLSSGLSDYLLHRRSTAPTNPGPGGYSVIKDMKPHFLGSEPGTTTNIRMEGLAIVHALKDARGAECEIRTDSFGSTF